MAFRLHNEDPKTELKRFGRRCALGVGALVVLSAVVGRRRNDVARAGCGKSRSETGPIIWSDDIEIVASASRMQNKRIFAFVGAEWDNGTKELEYRTFNDPDVRAVIHDRYIPLWIDVSDDELPRTKKALERFRIIGTPTIMLFTPNFMHEFERFNSYIDAERLLPSLLKNSETELARR
jgi:thiol:disulfide interchange protein